MRVLIVTAIYPPEPVISAQTSAQIADELLRQGHTVRVITSFPNRPGGKLFRGYKRQLYQNEEVAGIKVTRCFSFLSSESKIISRFLENCSFGFTSALAVIFSKRPDVIYSNTWPIFATGLLWLIARMRRTPVIISIQDIYPESLITQRRISHKHWISKILRYIDGVIARGSQAVITISENLNKVYLEDRKVSSDRIFLVPNWVNAEKISEYIQSDRYRHKCHISDHSFLIIYGGNIGVAAGLETVITSFQYLNSQFDFLIAGEGSQLFSVQELAKVTCPNQIHFYSPWPIEETLPLLKEADLLVLPTQGNQSLSSVPSKLINYMLAARPIIALALPDSDIAKVITKANCGWVVPPNQPHQLADKLEAIKELPERDRLKLGKNGRDFALKNFTQDTCLPKLIRIITEVAKSS